MFSKLSSFTLILAATALPVFSTPVILPRQDGPGHSYECEAKYNAAAKKSDLHSKGATAQDLAISIMETGCAFSGTAYPYGDQTPDGKPKTDDAANFGLFKNNWGNIRRYCSKFKGQTQDQWENGAELNTDDAEAIKCQHEQMEAQGIDAWFETQRYDSPHSYVPFSPNP
ncbi:MAG: hypothetical protein Q9170_006845 [Blastenia crenularia]